jgi:hypothetical protein
MPEPLDPLVKLGRENERLKLANADLRSMNRKLMRRGGGYDEFLEELRDVLREEDKFVFKSRSQARSKAKPFDENHEEIACVPQSDLHLAEEVSLEESNGINIYTPVIAANRVWEHCKKVKSILSRHMAIYPIKMIWSPILGDMVSGTIHPEQIMTNSLSDPASVILCTRLLYMYYQELKTLGLPIEIDTIVGNHPRMTVKMPTKRQAHTNLDWLIYEQLADRLADDDQFKTKVWTSQIGMRRLYDWKYRFEHGIQVSSGQEEQFESRIRDLFDDPVYREATKEQGAAFDQILIGNMHKPKFLERTIVNGSYIGQNELGQSWRLKPIKAQQLMWGVSKKHVRTWMYAVDMTHIRNETATNPMSEYAVWFMRRNRR